jgi:hypothetical protein
LENHTEADDIPVTAAFLNLLQILQSSKQRFIAESALAENMGQPKPEDYWTRCKELFYKEFGTSFSAAGLKLNEITFRGLMHLTVDEELERTLFEDLPRKFAFNPWLHQGKGGIKRLEAEVQRERQPA